MTFFHKYILTENKFKTMKTLRTNTANTTTTGRPVAVRPVVTGRRPNHIQGVFILCST